MTRKAVVGPRDNSEAKGKPTGVWRRQPEGLIWSPRGNHLSHSSCRTSSSTTLPSVSFPARSLLFLSLLT